MSELPIDSHPERELLERFARGELNGPEADAVECHLQTCNNCCQALREIPLDPLMYRLQAAFRPMRPDCPVIDLKIASNVVADGSEATEPRSKPLIVPGFEILEELGKGGMGVVYKARHLKLNRSVALKMILETNHHDPELLVRFVAEAKVIAQLEHPNIVHIFEIGRHD
ncbi:MAG TPA: protein kinase, partial [Gemmata sp.]|nr:protein kinase [Gemmata sp.]